MKAVVCRELGLADKLELSADWPEPEIGDNDVLIDVKAAGLNFPDVLIIQGKYQFQPDLPFVPGGECAGVVSAVGDKVTRFKVGDEVISMGTRRFLRADRRQRVRRVSQAEGCSASSRRRASASPTSRPTTPSSSAPHSRRVNACWCWAPRGASAPPPWSSAS